MIFFFNIKLSKVCLRVEFLFTTLFSDKNVCASLRYNHHDLLGTHTHNNKSSVYLCFTHVYNTLSEMDIKYQAN